MAINILLKLLITIDAFLFGMLFGAIIGRVYTTNKLLLNWTAERNKNGRG